MCLSLPACLEFGNSVSNIHHVPFLSRSRIFKLQFLLLISLCCCLTKFLSLLVVMTFPHHFFTLSRFWIFKELPISISGNSLCKFIYTKCFQIETVSRLRAHARGAPILSPRYWILPGTEYFTPLSFYTPYVDSFCPGWLHKAAQNPWRSYFLKNALPIPYLNFSIARYRGCCHRFFGFLFS